MMVDMEDQPTICLDCRHHFFKLEPCRDGWYMVHRCRARPLGGRPRKNYVTGAVTRELFFSDCEWANPEGKCPQYEKKPWWRFW